MENNKQELPKPEFVSLVEKMFNKYSEGLEITPEAQTRLVDHCLNYIYLVLSISETVSEFQDSVNIDRDHVNLAFDIIESKRNVLLNEDIAKISENIKSIRTHSLNIDGS